MSPQCCAAVSSPNTATLRGLSRRARHPPAVGGPASIASQPLANRWAPAALPPNYTQGILSKWHRGFPLRPDEPELPRAYSSGRPCRPFRTPRSGMRGSPTLVPRARLLPLPALPAPAWGKACPMPQVPVYNFRGEWGAQQRCEGSPVPPPGYGAAARPRNYRVRSRPSPLLMRLLFRSIRLRLIKNNRSLTLALLPPGWCVVNGDIVSLDPRLLFCLSVP